MRSGAALSVIAIIGLCIGSAQALPPTAEETAEARRWVAARFEEIEPGTPASWDQKPPFSFVYDGRPSSEFLGGWKLDRIHRKLDEARTEHQLTYSESRTGLVVRCVAAEWTDFPTVEWTLYLKNTGSADTPIIEAIQPIDVHFQTTGGSGTVLRYNTGDRCTADSYEPHADALKPGTERAFSPAGGRPTSGGFPYFNLVLPDGGTIAALSWAGQWAMKFGRDDRGTVRASGGQELTHFVLHAGEEVRTPLVVLLFYKGDWLRGQNLWRSWMVQHNLPRPGGRLVQPMASLCTGNHYPRLMSNASQELDFLRRHLAAGIRFDAWWQDAGWYPCGDAGWPKTGTWEVDVGRFPKGLREVSDFVHSQGIKSIVWFEPERVAPGTWLYEKHPEWLLGKGGGTKLLDLGNEAARRWLTDHIDRILTEQAIDVYRQDFNIDPLPFWRANDSPDRQGITEIRHVEGYLAFWDELKRRHPGLLIDSCASGGRRNDLETLRRAVPLLRSDWYNGPDGQQGQTYGLSLWFPFQGTGVIYQRDEYWHRSSFVAEFTFGPDAAGLKGVDLGLVRRMVEEHGRMKDCFYGEFYPLTPYSLSPEVWMAWQYDRPDLGRGLVQAFRRAESPYESARFKLRGLDAGGEYRVDYAGGSGRERYSGKELLEHGLGLELKGRPSALTAFYERIVVK